MRLVTAYPRHWYFAAGLALAIIVVTLAVGNDSASSRAFAMEMAATGRFKPVSAAGSSSRTAQASQQRLIGAYGKLPLSFEINQGQTDPRVKFLSRGSGYSLFLTENEAVLTLRKSSPSSSIGSEQARRRLSTGGGRLLPAAFEKPRAGQHGPETTAAVLRLRLVGANVRAKVTGLEQLPGKSNYFIGKDSRQWRSNVPNYAKVKYSNVYTGMDLVYYGNQRQLEYDFVVQPGADPRWITLQIVTPASSRADASETAALEVDGNGDLVVATGESEVRFRKPMVYQPTTNHGQRTTNVVAGKYALKGDRLTFEVASYDKTKPLVIDPTLAYSTYLGGTSGGSFGSGIAVDVSGTAYVTGFAGSSDFPTTLGAFQTTYANGDAFVSKLNAAGSALVYSSFLGGSGLDIGSGIAVDASGDAYVVGHTESTDFPATPGAFQTTLPGVGDAFVSKLNAAGSALLYSTYLGGTVFDYGEGITVDASSNAYVTGFTNSSDFPTTPGAFQTTYGGGDDDAFVSKLNAAGSALRYSTYLGGSDHDAGGGIAADASGNVFVKGLTGSSDFPTTPGAFQTACCGAFVSKLNAVGSALVYSTYLDGASGNGIAVDTSGDAYVTGFAGADFPTTPGAFQTIFGGGSSDAFVSKLNPAGSSLLYSTYLGGSGGFDLGNGIAFDRSGNAYVAGETGSSNFPTTPSAFQTTFGGGGSDSFVTKLNATGSALVYSTYLGGSGGEAASGIAVDASGSVYVTGDTTSTDFPTTPGAFQTAGRAGAFISKFSFCAQPKTKRDCKNGGWQRFCAPAFKNQGLCVAFVNHHQS